MKLAQNLGIVPLRNLQNFSSKLKPLEVLHTSSVFHILGCLGIVFFYFLTWNRKSDALTLLKCSNLLTRPTSICSSDSLSFCCRRVHHENTCNFGSLKYKISRENRALRKNQNKHVVMKATKYCAQNLFRASAMHMFLIRHIYGLLGTLT